MFFIIYIQKSNHEKKGGVLRESPRPIEGERKNCHTQFYSMIASGKKREKGLKKMGQVRRRGGGKRRRMRTSHLSFLHKGEKKGDDTLKREGKFVLVL